MHVFTDGNLKTTSWENNHWIRRLTGIVTEDIPVKGIGWLFLPSVHVHMLSTRRAELIFSRTRIIAALFSILTCLWIAIDFAFLPSDTATQLAYGRVTASTVFAALALSVRDSNSLKHAYIALVILFAIPTGFYIYSFLILSALEGNAFTATMLSLYAVLPIVVLAGISISHSRYWKRLFTLCLSWSLSRSRLISISTSSTSDRKLCDDRS